jgi:hypothetical protein
VSVATIGEKISLALIFVLGQGICSPKLEAFRRHLASHNRTDQEKKTERNGSCADYRATVIRVNPVQARDIIRGSEGFERF